MHTWRTWSWLLPIAAVGPALLWASPFGPARDMVSSLRLLVFEYPAWLLLTLVWLLPGILLARWRNWNIWYVVPATAVLLQLFIDGLRHWPPDRWWPTFIAGQPEVPSGHFLAFAFEAWHGYFYSLWAKAFIAFIAAVSLLIAQGLVPDRQPHHLQD